MGDYNQTLGNESGPVPLVVGGATYPLAYPDQAAKGRYETWLESRVMQAARRGKDDLDADSYRLLLTATRDDIANGEYRWGGQRWQAALATEDGLAMLLWLCLLPHDRKATLEQARDLIQKAYEEDPGEVNEDGQPRLDPATGKPVRQAEIVCVLLDLIAPGKATTPTGKKTAPAA